MLIKLKSLMIDADAQQNGGWVESITWPNVAYRVKSTKLEPFEEARETSRRRLMQRHENKIPDEVAVASLGSLLARHLLLDWKGFDIPYSPEAAADILGDAAFGQLIDDVLHAANRVGLPKIEFAEET